ncbi:MAG: class I SAM-dependent methyltransferase [Myxococcales bacterium]|nr:class I SAM-dependent methyltransferase [Myxococcales bacterium]
MLDIGLKEYLSQLNAVDDLVLNDMHERAANQRFPIIGPEVGRLVHLLGKAIGAKTVFELGSGFGYSAWWFAHVVGPDGLVYLTDTKHENLADAEMYLERSGLLDRCCTYLGDALVHFEAWNGKADIVFVDIDKQDYPKIFPLLNDRLRIGGMLIVDNILWSGRVYMGDDAESTHGVQQLTQLIRGDARYLWSIVPIRDGVLTALKVA